MNLPNNDSDNAADLQDDQASNLDTSSTEQHISPTQDISSRLKQIEEIDSIDKLRTETSDIVPLPLAEQETDAAQSDSDMSTNSQLVEELKSQLKDASGTAQVLQETLEALLTEKKELLRINDELATRLSAPNVTPDTPQLEHVDQRFYQSLGDLAVSDADKSPTRHIIIPVHRPKITHLSNMFNRLEASQADNESVKIFFVATDGSERDAIFRYIEIFRPTIPTQYEVISGIDLCNKFGFAELAKYLLENRNGGNINVKKILALYSSVLDGADEVITADMDVVFFKHPDHLFDRANLNFKKKIFFAAYPISDLMREIVLKSTRYYSLYDEKILLAKMQYGEIYSWFFDAPYYPRHETMLFLSHLQSLHKGMERALLAMNWYSFDHILFMYFLTLHSDFSLIDIRPDISEVEATDSFSIMDVLEISRKYSYSPVWASFPSILKTDAETLKELDLVVAIHSDRLA